MIHPIREVFGNALPGQDYFSGLNNELFHQYGFTRGNTRFGEGGCCDEINEPEYLFLQEVWGKRFKFGGLAGYCHAGRTGLSAVSQHVPEENGKKNLLLVGGPHIGYDGNEWGKVPRPGQRELTTACGSLIAALSAGPEPLRAKTPDPLDLQQQKVESLVLEYFQSASGPSLIGATQFVCETATRDLLALARDTQTGFGGQIAVISGVTINTEHGNFFSEHTKVVL